MRIIYDKKKLGTFSLGQSFKLNLNCDERYLLMCKCNFDYENNRNLTDDKNWIFANQYPFIKSVYSTIENLDLKIDDHNNYISLYNICHDLYYGLNNVRFCFLPKRVNHDHTITTNIILSNIDDIVCYRKNFDINTIDTSNMTFDLYLVSAKYDEVICKKESEEWKKYYCDLNYYKLKNTNNNHDDEINKLEKIILENNITPYSEMLFPNTVLEILSIKEEVNNLELYVEKQKNSMNFLDCDYFIYILDIDVDVENYELQIKL